MYRLPFSGIGVMPETLFVIAGQVAASRSNNKYLAQDTYAAMIAVKENFMGLNKELEVIYNQHLDNLTREKAHALALEFLDRQLSNIIPVREGATIFLTVEEEEEQELTWDVLKERSSGFYLKLIEAIEVANDDELNDLLETYPDLVNMFLEKA